MKNKLKLLHVAQIILEHTDEDHPLPMKELLKQLQVRGIEAERKSIYADIEALKTVGMDILLSSNDPKGYYVASRIFEPVELKLLVDSVQSSQFITERKSQDLIGKLEKLCSHAQAKLIHRQVHVLGRIKHMNESIYYNVDAIHEAIGKNEQITFLYFEYNLQKTRTYRHDAHRYQVSPYALVWNSENYYLIAYDATSACLKHYRVDRIENIQCVQLPRVGQEVFHHHDMTQYTHRTFSMYGGNEEQVTLQFSNGLIGVVLDRFGKEIMIKPISEQAFQITTTIMVSKQFYGWIFGLGNEAKIIAPSHVVEGMQERLIAMMSLYQRSSEDDPSTMGEK